MKLNKWLTSIIAIVPVGGSISIVASCNNGGEPEPESGSAEEYIKDRTFAIATIDASGSWKTAGTAWILSDATKTEFTDYNYYIATNWHVKLGFDNNPGVGIGYHCSGMNNNVYQKFSGDVVWNTYTDFCFESSVDCAIDFYIAKVNFGTADTIPSPAKVKLDKLNAIQKEKGYINKFGKAVSASDNYSSKKIFCGGYPAKNISGRKTQKWTFETVSDGTLFAPKGTKYLGEDEHAGHKVTDKELIEIWDQSANYMHHSYFPCTYDSFLKQYIPSGWGLTGGASGSMVVTQENNEWIVIGIYWGGWSLKTNSSVYFCPAWSIFKSTDKNFIQNYE